MVSRVLVAMAALIAVAHAQTEFALRWTPNINWEMVSGTFTRDSSPLDCFANTNLTLPFTYGYTYESNFTGTGEAAPASIGAKSCGNDDGRIDMYSDMVFAYPRDANANPVCLRKLTSTASIGNLNKPDATQTTFNQNFKYAITRTLQVCLYDSRFAPWNDQRVPSIVENVQKNADAELKVSYQSDSWKIYTSNWDGALQAGQADQDWEDISDWCAGNCDGGSGSGSAGSGDAWTNPSNTLYGTAVFSPTGRVQAPFKTTDGCGAQSSFTCAPSASDPIKSCGFAAGTATATNYRVAVTGGANDAPPVEQSACGTSNELLARSASFNHAGFNVDTFNEFDMTTLTAANAPGTATPYLYTVTPAMLDQNIGIHEDIIAMWGQVTMFAPTITHFQGAAVYGPNFQPGRTFYLNNGDLAIFHFNQANTEYNQIGFATAALTSAVNRVYLSNDLSGSIGSIAGTADSGDGLTQVAFDRTSGMASFLAQNGRFSSSGQGSGEFGEVGKHYWARVWSTYSVQMKWTCKNIGSTPDDTTKYPYRFSCDYMIDGTDGWTSTPGRKYKNNANQYPTMRRQFTTVNYNNWMPYTFSATSDPVYLGQFVSATNAGYSVAPSVAAVNGDAARATTPQEDATMKATTAAEDQATGVALIGAGVVVLAVFGSLAICIGAGILGKMQAK